MLSVSYTFFFWISQLTNRSYPPQARAAKLRQIESEFFKHVDVLDTSNFLDIDFETTETIFNYWKLKRRVSSCTCPYDIICDKGKPKYKKVVS